MILVAEFLVAVKHLPVLCFSLDNLETGQLLNKVDELTSLDNTILYKVALEQLLGFHNSLEEWSLLLDLLAYLVSPLGLLNGVLDRPEGRASLLKELGQARIVDRVKSLVL